MGGYRSQGGHKSLGVTGAWNGAWACTGMGQEHGAKNLGREFKGTTRQGPGMDNGLGWAISMEWRPGRRQESGEYNSLGARRDVGRGSSREGTNDCSLGGCTSM